MKCRIHRLQKGLVMAQQAQAMACSVSWISAIERGQKPAPESYPDQFADWLLLSNEERSELRVLAGAEKKIIKFVPKDPIRAAFASEIALVLNEMPNDELACCRFG
jgi:hypothetical protein